MGLFTEYFLNSSLHGLHFIADKRFHWTERFFWIMCVLVSWVCCLLLMVSAIGQYQSQEISFSVDTSYLLWKTNFPSIVICEKFNKKKMTQANSKVFGEVPDSFSKLEQFVYYDGDIKNKEFCEIGSSLRDKCLLRNYSAYMRQFRSTCWEVIGSCYYNNEQFPCCDEFFSIETYYGPCFAFNSLLSGKYQSPAQLPFKLIRDIDSGYGKLSLELFHAGFRIYGLSHDAVPTKDSEYALIGSAEQILPNSYYQSFLSVKPTYADEDVRLMSIKHRGCRYYDENNLQYSKIYSLSTCEIECLADAQKHSCNCTVHTLPHNENVKECDFDGILCTQDNGKIAQYMKSCSCTTSCFDMEVNNLGFTRTILQKSKVKDERSVVRIDFIVFPPSIHYTRSVVKNPLSMLVSVGGIAGLFLGASILTIVEMIYYFIIRPLNNKYLTHVEDENIRKVKQKNMDRFYGYHFEYVN